MSRQESRSSTDGPTVPIPGFAEWERRHAETKRDERDGPVVSADPPADEWAKRHGHCPGER